MTKYYTNCGNKLDDKVLDCLNCGVLTEDGITKNNSNNTNQKNKRIYSI